MQQIYVQGRASKTKCSHIADLDLIKGFILVLFLECFNQTFVLDCGKIGHPLLSQLNMLQQRAVA